MVDFTYYNSGNKFCEHDDTKSACVVTLKVPFINKSSEMLENKIRQLIRNTYYAANPRIVFTSMPLLTQGGKDPVSNLNKSMVIYQYSCCCTASYIGLTTRHLSKRIKEHVPKSVENFALKTKKMIYRSRF